MKNIILSISKPTTSLAAQREAQALYHRLGKQAFVKNKKSFRYMVEFFSRRITTTWKWQAIYI